ncbi:hypothetical protein Tco_0339142 [Tanacetum coccineum]
MMNKANVLNLMKMKEDEEQLVSISQYLLEGKQSLSVGGFDNAQINQIQENKKRRDEHAEIIANTKNLVSGSSDQKQAPQLKTKWAYATDVGPAVQAKRRVVLKDIFNSPFDGSSVKVVNEVKAQTSKQIKKCTAKKNERVAPSIRVEPRIQNRITKDVMFLSWRISHCQIAFKVGSTLAPEDTRFKGMD